MYWSLGCIPCAGVGLTLRDLKTKQRSNISETLHDKKVPKFNLRCGLKLTKASKRQQGATSPPTQTKKRRSREHKCKQCTYEHIQWLMLRQSHHCWDSMVTFPCTCRERIKCSSWLCSSLSLFSALIWLRWAAAASKSESIHQYTWTRCFWTWLSQNGAGGGGGAHRTTERSPTQTKHKRDKKQAVR